MQDGESERIQYKTESAILNEKYQNIKKEAEELKMKLNCEYTERVNQLDMQCKILKDELSKKET